MQQKLSVNKKACKLLVHNDLSLCYCDKIKWQRSIVFSLWQTKRSPFVLYFVYEKSDPDPITQYWQCLRFISVHNILVTKIWVSPQFDETLQLIATTSRAGCKQTNAQTIVSEEWKLRGRSKNINNTCIRVVNKNVVRRSSATHARCKTDKPTRGTKQPHLAQTTQIHLMNNTISTWEQRKGWRTRKWHTLILVKSQARNTAAPPARHYFYTANLS